MTLQGDEPELQLGDTGEHVVQLQDRLRAFGAYQQLPDGTFDDQTEQALREVQNQLGMDPHGRMDQQAWGQLDQHMMDRGLEYSPYAGAGNQLWDQPGSAEQAQSWDQTQGWDQSEGWDQTQAWDQTRGWDQSSSGDQWSGRTDWSQQSRQWDSGTAQGVDPTEQTGEQDAPPVIPHPDTIHPNIANDERFGSFTDFLREHHGVV